MCVFKFIQKEILAFLLCVHFEILLYLSDELNSIDQVKVSAVFEEIYDKHLPLRTDRDQFEFIDLTSIDL